MNNQAGIRLPSSDHPLSINKQHKKLEIKSRLFSPTSTPNSSMENGFPSPNRIISPAMTKHNSNPHKNRRRFEDDISVQGGVKKKSEKEMEDDRNAIFRRQRSCSEFSSRLKENQTPTNFNFGGSSRYTEKFEILRNKNSYSSSMYPSAECSSTAPGRRKRFSVDDVSCVRQPSSSLLIPGRFRNCHDFESDVCSSNESVSSTNSLETSSTRSSSSSKKISRKPGKQVSSRYLLDVFSRSRHRDSNNSNNNNLSASSLDSSQTLEKFRTSTLLRRVNSVSNNTDCSSKRWTLDSEEKKSNYIGSSSLKPPSNPCPSSRVKGVGNLIIQGLDFFKTKRSNLAGVRLAATGAVTVGESVHQLKLLHNRLVQWQYVNAKSQAVNNTVKNHAQSKLTATWDSLAKLRSSVMQKKQQLEKEKLEMKLNSIVQSQMKLLDVWEEMKDQHLSAISETKDYLYSAVCRVPLSECTNADLQLIAIALRQASCLSASIESMLINFTPLATELTVILWELADVVMMEKSLLEECFGLIGMISTLEVEERSLRCSIIQLRKREQQRQHEIDPSSDKGQIISCFGGSKQIQKQS